MPAWIHNRAEHLLAKNPSMSKSQAFAIATQQSHKLGKSPKGYGTAAGKKGARAKYDKPRKEYKKGANPGDLETPKLPREKSKESAMRAELHKEAISQRDNPYMLDQIGKPKTRKFRAEAPEPKYRVKQAMMPGAGEGIKSFGVPKNSLASPQKKLQQSQKIGVPKIQQPKMQTMQVKLSSGDMVEYFQKHPKKYEEWKERRQAKEKTAWLRPLILGTGAAGGATSGALEAGEGNRLGGALLGGGVGALTAGGGLLVGRKFGGSSNPAVAIPSVMGALASPALGSIAGGVAGKKYRQMKRGEAEEQEKKAYSANQYSGNMGPGPLRNYAAHLPPFRVPQLGPGTKTAGPPSEGTKMKKAMVNELSKLNGVATTPAGKLYQAQSVGEPKTTAPSGPSLADQSKPLGFGLKLPGSTKSGI